MERVLESQKLKRYFQDKQFRFITSLILITLLFVAINCDLPIKDPEPTPENLPQEVNNLMPILDACVGLPLINLTDQIVKHYAIILDYSEEHEQSKWVAYRLTKIMVETRNWRPFQNGG